MNRAILTTLLCTLAVMIFFIATSCSRPGIISGGSSGTPPAEPGNYIKIGGGSWQKIPQNKLIRGNLGIGVDQIDNLTVPIPANCQTVIYGYRLLPEEINALGTYFDTVRPFLSSSSGLDLAPAVITPADAFVPSLRSRVMHDNERAVRGDHSKTDTAKGYVVIEYQLPPSESGMYGVETIDLKVFFLKRPGGVAMPEAQSPPALPASVGELTRNVFYTNVKNVTLFETRWTHYTDAAIGDRVSFLIYTEMTNTSTDQTLVAQLTGQLGNNLQYIHQSAYVRKNNGDQQPMPDNWITGEHNLAVGLRIDPRQTVPVEITFDAWVEDDPSNPQNRLIRASATLQDTNSTATDTATITIEPR